MRHEACGAEYTKKQGRDRNQKKVRLSLHVEFITLKAGNVTECMAEGVKKAATCHVSREAPLMRPVTRLETRAQIGNDHVTDKISAPWRCLI